MAVALVPFMARKRCLDLVWIVLVAMVSLGCTVRWESDSATDVGSTSQPIVAGQPVEPDALPGVVAVLRGQQPVPECTGTLVAPDVVVTAAHCVDDAPDPTDVRVRASSGVATVAHIAIHASFPAPLANNASSLGAVHDVAALILNEDLATAPAEIATSAALETRLVPGLPITIAGYGATEAGDSAANARLFAGGARVVERSDFEFLSAGGSGADTCHRDSGGPAFASIEGEVRLVGITSRTRVDAVRRCGDGTIFAIASEYRSFVESVSGRSMSAEPAPVGFGPPDPSAGCSAAPVSPNPSAPLPALLVVLGAVWRLSRKEER